MSSIRKGISARSSIYVVNSGLVLVKERPRPP